MRNLLLKIQRFYYMHVMWFCEWRANRAFDRQNVYQFMQWEKRGFEYCDKFVAIR